MRMPPVTPLIPGADTTAPTTPTVTGFTVSFAALLDQRRAQEMASSITVDGRSAHLVPAVRQGVTVFRVVLGPYSSRAEAERAGKASGRQYWVYEGPP